MENSPAAFACALSRAVWSVCFRVILGLEVTPGTPEELAALVKSDIAKWTKVIREAGVKVD